ncbi:MAG TPA: hypothetical protein VK590_11535 [Saprospiraceae bacterium]|nr:hypothetical protein [Saprospiraceae bacterium]
MTIRTITALFAAAIVMVILFLVFQAIGFWFVGILKRTHGFIEAADIIAIEYLIPGLLATVGAMICFFILNDRDV